MILSRWGSRLWPRERNSIAELRVGNALNSLLGKVMDFEGKMIKAERDFHVGGSLLAVALKQ
jgi:hypothetical protein